MRTATLQFELPAMPESENRYAQAWRETMDEWNHFRKDFEAEDGLIMFAMAARLLGISRQRLNQLMNDGRLTRFHHLDHAWLSRRELKAWASSERSKGGRPRKNPVE